MTVELRLIGHTLDAYAEELTDMRTGPILWVRTIWGGRDVVITAKRWTTPVEGHHVVDGEFNVTTAPDEYVTTRGLAWVQAQQVTSRAAA